MELLFHKWFQAAEIDAKTVEHMLAATPDQPVIDRVGWHTFQHTFSTLMASLGVEAKVVQELMRHASFRTTMDSYTQALDEPKRQAQKRLADLIMRTGTAGHA
jgi:integrase